MSDMDEGGEGEMADGLDPSMMGEGGGGGGGLNIPGVDSGILLIFVEKWKIYKI
jgi:hypothetical protein